MTSKIGLLQGYCKICLRNSREFSTLKIMRVNCQIKVLRSLNLQLATCGLFAIIIVMYMYNVVCYFVQKGRLPFQNAAIYGHTEALKLLLKEPGIQVDSLMKVHYIHVHA